MVYSLSLVEDLEFKKVHLRGRYIYENQFAIQPRGRFDQEYAKSAEAYGTPMGAGVMGGSPQISSHGGHIITPMLLEGTESVYKLFTLNPIVHLVW